MDFKRFHHLVTAELLLESWVWTGGAKFPLKATWELMVALLLAQGDMPLAEEGITGDERRTLQVFKLTLLFPMASILLAECLLKRKE